MGRSKNTQLRERLKGLKERNTEKERNAISVEITNVDKISELKSRIANCKCDLLLFPGNPSILEKIKSMEEYILKLQNEK